MEIGLKSYHMKTIKLLRYIFLLTCSYSFAQFGIGTATTNASAQLEVVATNKGVLIPQIALSSDTDTTTITSGNIESLLVYNTNASSGLSLGYYYWSNAKWNKITVLEDKTTVSNTLTSTSTTEALAANQGKVLEDSKAAKTNVLELDNTATYAPSTDYEPATKKYVDDTNIIVENILTSTNIANALSANQGKVLQDNKLDKTLIDGTFFIGDGTGNAVSQTISSDATITNMGVLTIADDAVDGTDISLASEAAGDVMFNNGTDWVRLAKGTANQYLQMNATATAPEWVTPVSKRIGEFVYAKTGKTEVEGYLAVSPGTISNGAVSYPLWAAQYPEFVSGNDIVFPTDVAGMFLRNNGGNAAAEGSFQNYRTARPTTSAFGTSTNGNHFHSISVHDNDGGSSAADGGGRADGYPNTSSAGNHTHTISSGGDIETNPINRAYQLYTIVDTY